MRREPEALGGTPFDVLIVGGGIVGCSIARDAALRGLRVALVERDDFAAGTSSRTSKLAHGGLRYLEQGRLGLVMESVRERERLLRLASHLVRPYPFLLPYERGNGWPPFMWMLRIGLFLYDAFAGRNRIRSHRFLSAAELIRKEPGLVGRKLVGGALYYDGQMDDTRITLENAIAAAEAGAVVVNHAEVAAFTRDAAGRVTGARIRADGRDFEVAARLVVNAAGPWGDAVLGLAGRAGRPVLRPTKGVHVVYGDRLVDTAMILRTQIDHRVFFILPWNGLTLIGTTDTDFAGDPGKAEPEPTEIQYLLDAAAAALPALRIHPDRVVSAFAGVRPLLAGSALHPSASSREHSIREQPPGLLSVLGGKFTTYREMAEQATDRIEDLLGRKRTPCPTANLPLPGAVASAPPPPGLGTPETGVLRVSPDVETRPPSWERLLARYGARTTQVLEAAGSIPGGLDPLCPHTWHIRGEIVHAIRAEMAGDLEDLLVRRLGITHTCVCRGTDAAEAAAAVAAPLLGWDDARRAREVEGYRLRWKPLKE
ncbi:MAG: glycerol-3-phosphate dehydrogenase/oxidase [Candidatus Coatesbacteria bacterium]